MIQNLKKQKIAVQNISYKLLLLWIAIPIFMTIVCVWLGISHPSIPKLNKNGTYSINIDYYLTRYTIHKWLFIILGIVSLMFITFTILKSKNFFKKKNLVSFPWIYSLLISLPWAFICCLTSGIFIETFFGRKFLFNGLFTFIIFGSAYGCALILQEEKHRLNVIKLYTNIILFLSIVVILQAYVFPFLNRAFNPDFATIFNQHNHFGYILCMSIVATLTIYLFDSSLSQIKKVFYLSSFSIQTIALLVNDTFGSYLAIIIALPFIYFFYFKKTKKFSFYSILPLIIFILIAVLTSFDVFVGVEPVKNKLIKFINDFIAFITNKKSGNKAGTGRGYLWKETIKRIKKRPLFGYGPAGLIGENAIMNAGKADSPHNEFLQRAVCIGIPGLILYLIALFTLASYIVKNFNSLNNSTIISSGIVLTYLISSCFGNPVFNTAIFFYIFLGIVSSDNNNENIQSLFVKNIKINTLNISDIKDSKLTKYSAGIIILFLILFIILDCIYFPFKNEPIREKSDLTSMQAAIAAAKLAKSKGNIKIGTTYWFDQEEMCLKEITDEDILPYGSGTRINGHTLADFNKEYGQNINYNEENDYTDKIIVIWFDKNDTGKTTYNLKWISVSKPILGG